MPLRFAHLHLHSEYSLVDSTIRIKALVEACVRDGVAAVALTDECNMFALVKFYKACSAAGIKPIGGCDLWISAPDDPRPWRLTLLCQNREGYLNLSRLVSRAWREGQHGGRALVDAAWLTAEASSGLIALLGRDSEIGRIAVNQGTGNAGSRLHTLMQLFPDRLYLELTRCGREGEEAWNNAALTLATELDLPVIASNDVRFLKQTDFEAHEARVCINQGRVLADPKRPRDYSEQQYLKSPIEMSALFADIPEALDNTVELAKRCNLELTFGTYFLPDFPVPEGHDLASYIREISREGLKERLALAPLAAGYTLADYEARLERELDVIIKMGFPGYFLIVADFINWGKQNGIPVGPGRGSGAGSLVAWVLKITDLDPLQFNLLFERFLNPERVSMPDFDIDFCMDRRDEVIDYVSRKYGRDHVSQIITYGSMAAKAVLRDSGRVLGMGYNAVDRIAKLIPPRPLDLTLSDALGRSEKSQKEPDRVVKEFCELYQQDEEAKSLIDLALKLENLTRNAGKHAGGVVIAPTPLTDFAPLYCEAGGGGVVTQYDKDDVEAVGLVKFDFLGLRTLTIIDWAVKAINVRREQAGEAPLDIAALPLDDPAPYELLKKAQTVAVFQLESSGMQRMLKDAKPDRFEDIIALVALYRPGPMDLIPSFVARKHGREEVEYPDPRVEPILKETYGIMVYQEQVMQMAQIIGGYSLGGADLLRRAMGKKKAEEMAEHRALFREGAAKNGLTGEKADEIFDLMEKFAGYGFNKSHAAAYALLAYHTAWLKAHHPAEFMAANMSLAMDDTDKVKILFEDCITNKMAVLPPDINLSAYRFEPVAEADGKRSKTIRYGLGAIKGSGQNAIEEILRAREEGPFIDLFDFCNRIDRRIVNRRTVEALIRAGAFDTLHANRAQLIASVSLAMEAAEQASANAMQAGLFDMGDAPSQGHELVDEPEWAEKKKLQEEKGALGFYLSGHLFDAYKDEVRRFARQKIGELKEGRDKLIAGVIASLRTQMTQRGKMLIALLDDGTGQCEVTVFNETFEAHKQLFKEDELLVVQGQARNDAFTGGIRFTVETVMDLGRARCRYAEAVKVQMNGNADALALRRVLEAHSAGADEPQAAQAPATPSRGGGFGGGGGRNGGGYGGDGGRQRQPVHIPNGLAVQIVYRSENAEGEVRLGDAWRVKPTDELLAALRGEFAGSSIEIVY
jgi:DNA polymerase-3 subunit alpha